MKKKKDWTKSIVEKAFEKDVLTYIDDEGNLRIQIGMIDGLESLVTKLHLNINLINYYQMNVDKLLAMNTLTWKEVYGILKDRFKEDELRIKNLSGLMFIDFVTNTIVIKENKK